MIDLLNIIDLNFNIQCTGAKNVAFPHRKFNAVLYSLNINHFPLMKYFFKNLESNLWDATCQKMVNAIVFQILTIVKPCTEPRKAVKR